MKKRIRQDDVLLFLQELARLAKSQLPLDEGLKAMERGGKGSISWIASEVVKELEKGESLATAVNKTAKLNVHTAALLEAGEQSGVMGEVLQEAVQGYRRAQLSRRAIRQAIRYPLFILVLFLVISSLILIVLVPKYKDLYVQLGAELPYLTLLILSLSDLIINYGIILFCPLGIIFALYYLFRKTIPGRVIEANVQLKIPFVGRTIFCDVLGRFCRSLALLLKRGLPTEKAVVLSGAIIDHLAAKQIAGKVNNVLAQGKSLSEGFRSSEFFPPSFIWMIQKGEDRGEVIEVLSGLADFYDEQYEDFRDRVRVVLEPVLLLILGIIMGIIIISIYLPMFWIPILIS